MYTPRTREARALGGTREARALGARAKHALGTRVARAFASTP